LGQSYCVCVRVNANHIGAEAGQCQREYARATANVENALPVQLVLGVCCCWFLFLSGFTHLSMSRKYLMLKLCHYPWHSDPVECVKRFESPASFIKPDGSDICRIDFNMHGI
jgi:hypothetical protein